MSTSTASSAATATATARTISQVADTNVVMEGGGVPVRRALPSRVAIYPMVDPFLLLDHFKLESRMMEGGFPPHPHRGFEIVTYYLQGSGSHSDSEGNEAVVHSGGLQRITAGRGIWHGEGPGSGDNGPMEGLQLWINLPRQEKGIDPGYQGVEASELPSHTVGDALVKTLVGEGAPTVVQTPSVYYDVTVPAGGRADLPLPAGYQGFAYLLSGAGSFGSNGQAASAGQVAVLGPGEALPIEGGPQGAHFVLAAGRPLHEQPRWNGPYVD